jgi:hypothetical protein
MDRAADTSVGSLGLRCSLPSTSGSTGGTVGEGVFATGLTADFVSFRGRVTFALERNVSEIFDCEAERAVVGAIVSCLVEDDGDAGGESVSEFSRQESDMSRGMGTHGLRKFLRTLRADPGPRFDQIRGRHHFIPREKEILQKLSTFPFFPANPSN